MTPGFYIPAEFVALLQTICTVTYNAGKLKGAGVSITTQSTDTNGYVVYSGRDRTYCPLLQKDTVICVFIVHITCMTFRWATGA